MCSNVYMHLSPLKIKKIPNPPTSIFKMIGPSIIFVGLALGSGELIMWPYLVSHYGLGIIWGALIGITMQFFLNTEILRYTLANGESIFVGFARIFKKIPIWFVVSTIVAWSWPGFASSSAELLTFFGIENANLISMLMLLLIGIILTSGKNVYKTVENIEKVLVVVGISSIFLIAFYVVDAQAVKSLLLGLIGIGEGYFILPFADENFPYASFLAALAYAGAGGNLLLAQSFYVKEKGYGMGVFSSKISNLLDGKDQELSIEGATFKPIDTELSKFNKWWNFAYKEHLIVFWGLGLLTMLLLALISYSTAFSNTSIKSSGIGFLFEQANNINSTIHPLLGSFLLLITALMLFSTQLTVIDAAGRIIAENIAILGKSFLQASDLAKYYFVSVWSIITFGIGTLMLGFDQPYTLLIVGAIINAVCMFVFSGILIKTNVKLLHNELHPHPYKRLIIYGIFGLLGLFCTFVIGDAILKGF